MKKMIKRDELIHEINLIIGEALLAKARAKDELANGVQILGKEEVEKVALGVSLNEEFLQEAVKWEADFCIFHHGLDVRTFKSEYPIYTQKRLKLIFDNNITIAGYHGSLDMHPQIGNNAVIVKELGAEIVEPLYQEWGYTAIFNTPQDIHELADKCQKLFNQNVFVVANGPEKVRKIGVVSGAAKPYEEQLIEMQAKGVELYISGETSESAPHKMLEARINYFVCGHYATEVFGVKALGEELKSKFKSKLQIKFIDVKNEI